MRFEDLVDRDCCKVNICIKEARAYQRKFKLASQFTACLASALRMNFPHLTKETSTELAEQLPMTFASPKTLTLRAIGLMHPNIIVRVRPDAEYRGLLYHSYRDEYGNPVEGLDLLFMDLANLEFARKRHSAMRSCYKLYYMQHQWNAQEHRRTEYRSFAYWIFKMFPETEVLPDGYIVKGPAATKPVETPEPAKAQHQEVASIETETVHTSEGAVTKTTTNYVVDKAPVFDTRTRAHAVKLTLNFIDKWLDDDGFVTAMQSIFDSLQKGGK